jgi:uncharacterized protein YcfJ
MKHVNLAAVAFLGMVVAGPALARYTDSYFDYARVLQVDRVATQAGDGANVAREECWQEPIEQRQPGVVYHRELPTVVEHTADGGRVVTTRTQDVEHYPTTTRSYAERCREEVEYRQPQTVAYDVVYRYHGQDYHDRIGHDPGSSVRVHVDNGYVEIAE